MPSYDSRVIIRKKNYDIKFFESKISPSRQKNLSISVPQEGAVRNMMYVVTLTHTPELCLARKEFSSEFKPWLEGMDDLAKNLNIKIHGAYVCPNEHTLYFILESGDFKDITAFFSGIMLMNNTGRISSVLPLKEGVDIVSK